MTAAEDVGTWEFRAPRLTTEGLTEQCDLYSLAAVLFHTITGRLHFDREQGTSPGCEQNSLGSRTCPTGASTFGDPLSRSCQASPYRQ